MRFVVLTIIASCLLLANSTVAASSNSCECEVISCNSCQRETNIEFYTAKCAAGSRVKSCQRPVCAELEDPPAECQKNMATAPMKEVVAIKQAKVAEKTPVGTVLMSIGDVQVKREGVLNPLKVSHKIFNDDEI